jgi:hypothetical protein
MKTSHIEEFLQQHYSDSALMNLLHECETGKVSYMNANHCLLGLSDAGFHYYRNSCAEDYTDTAMEFMALGERDWWPFGKEYRRRIAQAMIPIIQREIDRRANAMYQVHAMYQVQWSGNDELVAGLAGD